jgi:hypothetical protein
VFDVRIPVNAEFGRIVTLQVTTADAFCFVVVGVRTDIVSTSRKAPFAHPMSFNTRFLVANPLRLESTYLRPRDAVERSDAAVYGNMG